MDAFAKCRNDLKSQGRLFYFSLISLMMMIWILNAGPFMMDDTDSYHIQMVKWIQEYGSVPGIANLHLRFGFNSSWFISIAQFGYPVQGLNNYGSLNGLLSVWLCYYLLETFFNSIRVHSAGSNSFTIACIVVIFLCLVNWPMIRGSAMSANYDFVSTFGILILFIDLMDIQKEPPLEWLIWPVYLVTVRMMNFPLLILSAAFIFRFLNPVSTRKLFLSIFAAGFMIIPFLVRNIILSGYPFFPVYQLDFFSFDWKADKVKLIEIAKYIKYFNRVNPAVQPLGITEKLDFPDWVASWFVHLFRFDRLILILSFLGYILLLTRVRTMNNRLTSLFLFVMVCQLIAWFCIAPDPRFVYGPLLFGVFAAIAGLTSLNGFRTRFVRNSVAAASFILFSYAVSKVLRDSEYRNFLIPRPVPVPAIQTIAVDHIQIHIPERILNNWNPRCYDVALPCLYRIDPRLKARGSKIADGFMLKDTVIATGGEYKITE